ncbi:hypothetical protein [Ferdinandcohnia sp. SAFN-114]
MKKIKKEEKLKEILKNYDVDFPTEKEIELSIKYIKDYISLSKTKNRE